MTWVPFTATDERCMRRVGKLERCPKKATHRTRTVSGEHWVYLCEAHKDDAERKVSAA